MRTIIPLVMLSFVSAGCVRRGPEDVVRRFHAALNDHDVDRAIAWLDDDYAFRDAAGSFAVPREAIRPMLAWDAALHSRSEATILRTWGDTVVVRQRETNDFLELLGVAPWSHEVTYVVEGNRIAVTIVDDAGALHAAVDRALEPVLTWARRTRPERLEGLVTDRGLVYDGDAARLWVGLLREARAAGVLGPGGETL